MFYYIASSWIIYQKNSLKIYLHVVKFECANREKNSLKKLSSHRVIKNRSLKKFDKNCFACCKLLMRESLKKFVKKTIILTYLHYLNAFKSEFFWYVLIKYQCNHDCFYQRKTLSKIFRSFIQLMQCRLLKNSYLFVLMKHYSQLIQAIMREKRSKKICQRKTRSIMTKNHFYLICI